MNANYLPLGSQILQVNLVYAPLPVYSRRVALELVV
uniref:ABC transporter ATP-binding protein n=1 Tax=Hydatigena taeniaeformis TaxID=6205 RepID=A0A0R3X929_HYDTA